jgi:hypothetical protein
MEFIIWTKVSSVDVSWTQNFRRDSYELRELHTLLEDLPGVEWINRGRYVATLHLAPHLAGKGSEMAVTIQQQLEGHTSMFGLKPGQITCRIVESGP